jgi:hypothetical protein
LNPEAFQQLPAAGRRRCQHKPLLRGMKHGGGYGVHNR